MSSRAAKIIRKLRKTTRHFSSDSSSDEEPSERSTKTNARFHLLSSYDSNFRKINNDYVNKRNK